MNKKNYALYILSALLIATTLTGCKTAGKKSAGGRGGDDSVDQFGLGAGFNADGTPIGSEDGANALTDRFSGGTEYPGTFEAVYFEYDSDLVPDSERAKIEAVAEFLTNDDSKSIIIDGHSDERGSIVYNQNLSEKRALSIRTYLIDLGIDSARIQTRGFGEEAPVAPDHDESSWGQNRRGEFVLYY